MSYTLSDAMRNLLPHLIRRGSESEHEIGRLHSK